MNKDNILYAIIGLLVGVLLGFIITNSINRSVSVITPSSASAGATVGGAGALPPDHPPLGAAGGAAPAEVTSTVEKARREPTNFEAQMQAAGLFSQIQRYEQALEFLERAYKLKPGNFEVLANLGNVSFDLGRYPDAERWYQLALKIKPEEVNVRTDLGLSYYLREPRELDKAIASYRASLGYDPRHEKTLQNLASALIDKGDRAAARETLKRLEEVNPNNPAIASLRAQLGAP